MYPDITVYSRCVKRKGLASIYRVIKCLTLHYIMRSRVVISYNMHITRAYTGSVVNPPFTTSRRNEAAVIKSMKGTML